MRNPPTRASQCGRPKSPWHDGFSGLGAYRPKKRTEPLRATLTPFGERMRRVKAEQRPALTEAEIERAAIAFLRSYYDDVMRHP